MLKIVKYSELASVVYFSPTKLRKKQI
jgi:hypothetical protein